MTRFATLTASIALLTGTAFAGDVSTDARHKGQLTGHDGKQWVMEGCAAYPVTASAAPRQSRPTPAPNSYTPAPRKLAKNSTATATE